MTRNRASAKKAGTRWESEICTVLVEEGWPHAERRRLNGVHDKGDIAGVIGFVIEAKDEKTIALAAALNEAHKERDNAGAEYGVAWIKRPRFQSARDGYVVMSGSTFLQLLKEAGR